MLSLPPGYQATQDELLRSLIAARGGEGGQGDIQQGGAGVLQPPPAAAGTPSLQSFRDALAKIRAEVDDTALSQPPEPGWFSQMGTALKETIQDPSSWPTVAKNFGKGAVSGATMGLSELIPEMRPDEESWAGSVGNLAGFIPTAMGGAGLVGRLGAKLGSKALASTLGKEVVSGAALGVVQPRVENWAKGKEEDRSVLQDAAIGAALPAAAGAVGRGLRRLIKGPPPMATLTPDEAIARGTAKSTKTLGASGLTPDVEKQLHDFIKTGKQPLDAALPRPEQHVPGFVRASQELVDDTGPLAHGTPLVSEMGEELTYLRPGVSTGKSIVKDSKGLTRAIDDTKFQRDPSRLPQPPSSITATPPAESPLGGTPGPSPASTPPVDTPPTFWEGVKQKTRALMDSLNIPSRVLGLNPAIPEGKLAIAGFKTADAATRWAQDMEFVYKLKMPRGTKGEKALWEQIGDKKFLINTMLQNQGDEAAAMAKLAQHQEGTLMQQFLMNWNKADDMFVKKAVEYGLMKPNPDGSMPRILNHLPFVRYKAVQPADVKVEIGGDMRKVATWAMEHPRASSFMAKHRKHTEVPDLDLRGIKPEDLVALKIKGMANMFANHEEMVLGGLGKNGMRIGPNGAPQYWIDDVLQSIKDPHKREYAVNYVNHMFGHSGGGFNLIEPGTAAKLRRLQFYHLIAGNMLTPGINLTQTLVTYSRVSTGNWGKAFLKLLSDEKSFPMPGSGEKVGARFFAEKVLGASGTFNRVDEEILTAGVFGRLGQALSAPFRLSERINQKHAAIAGYMEGISRGMGEAEAIQFGTNLNRMTQQFGGRANTPAAFRGPVGSLLGQFKSFQIGWMGAVKDMITEAGQGMQKFSAGDPQGLLMMKPLIKYMGAVAALGGPAAIFGKDIAGAVQEQIMSTLNTEMPDWTRNGFLGLLGVNLSNQVGLGALPVTSNFRDVLWFAPGPLVSHILDGMSVAMFVADSVPGLAVIPRFLRGEGVQLEPTAGARGGISFELSNIGQQMSYDDFMSKATRSIPMAGPQLDKIRKFIKAKQAGGGEAEAMSLLQSLGWELPTGGYTRPAPDQGPLEKALGVPKWVSDLKPLVFTPQERAEDIEKRAEMIETGQQYTSALRTYHSLVAAGMSDKAMDFARQYEEMHGHPLIPSDQALEAAYARRNYPAIERLRQGAPWPLSVEWNRPE